MLCFILFWIFDIWDQWFWHEWLCQKGWWSPPQASSLHLSGLSYHPRGTKAAKWQLWNVFHEFPWSHSMMPQDHSLPLSDSKSIFSPWIPTLIYPNNGERNNESFGVSQWNQRSNCWYGWWLHKPKPYDLVDVTSKTGLLPRNESPQKTTRDEHRFTEIVQTWDERWDLPTVVDVLFVNLEFLWVSEIAQIRQLNSQLILGPSRTFRIPMATQGSCPTSTLRSLEPPRAQRRVKARKNGEWGSYGKFMEIHRQKRKWRRIENLVDMSNWWATDWRTCWRFWVLNWLSTMSKRMLWPTNRGIWVPKYTRVSDQGVAWKTDPRNPQSWLVWHSNDNFSVSIGKPFLSWVKSFATVHDCFARLKVQQAWTCFQPVLRIPHQLLSE